MTNHPVDLSSLYKIMDDNLIDTTMQRYREAKEVQVAISRVRVRLFPNNCKFQNLSLFNVYGIDDGILDCFILVEVLRPV